MMERKLAAILAADVVGYSRLMEGDEAGTFNQLRTHRKELFEPEIGKHHGRIFKLMGDGLLAEFASAVDAVECAVTLQRGMAERNANVPDDRRIDVRIGINLGEVIIDGEDRIGEGVNIAARLQQLAEAGGICVSAKVAGEVEKRLSFGFEPMGEHQVKNIAEPIAVYRVRSDATKQRRKAPHQRLWKVAAAVAAVVVIAVGAMSAAYFGRQDGSTLPLPDKPSIAVLPFENLSADREQDYFANGITENIITGLSRFHDLFVIARTSTFAYKGKPVTVQQVGRELGVRYVLEGSVQRSGANIRITAQLIDATTGEHLWAERYDRAAEDIFSLQDEVTTTIAGTLGSAYGGRLRKAWRERSTQSEPSKFQAFDHFLRGLELVDKFTKEDNSKSRYYFREAIKLDPNYGKAFAKLAWSHIIDATFGWSEDIDVSWQSALTFAKLAIERDDDEPWGHWAIGAYYMYQGQNDRAVAEYKKALELNPNDADIIADLGWILSYAGRAEEVIELMKRGMRLNPHYPEWYPMQLGQVYFDAGRYEDAVEILSSLRHLNTMSIQLYLAASYAALGDAQAAKMAVQRALELDGKATVKMWASPKMAPYKKPEDLEHFRTALRKAGLPEE